MARDYSGFKTATARKAGQVLSKSIHSAMQINQRCKARVAELPNCKQSLLNYLFFPESPSFPARCHPITLIRWEIPEQVWWRTGSDHRNTSAPHSAANHDRRRTKSHTLIIIAYLLQPFIIVKQDSNSIYMLWATTVSRLHSVRWHMLELTVYSTAWSKHINTRQCWGLQNSFYTILTMLIVTLTAAAS